MNTTRAIRETIAAETLPLDAAGDASTCGHKAAALAALRRAGFPVPDGFVVPVHASISVESLAGALERLGPGPWAVRSSGIAEDLDGASFAGQYESVLGVTTAEDVVAAVARVRVSGRASHVAKYRGTHGGAADAGVAVLIQHLVQASAAGVAFSTNPVTGDDEVVVEGVRGLGDRLASGDADADRWVIGSAARPVVDTGVINQSTAQAIAALARRIAETRGGPQDIEWALDRGEVIVLQARPITGLPLAPALDIPPGRWMKDSIHWSGPMTPVGASILSPLVETMLAEVFAEFGVPLERMLVRPFGGEIYMQEIEIGGRHNTGAPPPWWLGAIAFRCVPPLRRVATTARQALPKLEAYPRAWEESWRAECTSRIEKARAVDLRQLDDEALAGHLDQLVDEVLTPNLRAHFRLVLPDIVALYDLAVCCRELLGWDDGQMLELLAGLSTTATQPALELAEVSELAGADAVSQGLGAVRATSAGPRLDAWLNRWGLRGLEFDPGAPTVSEQESLILQLLRQPHRTTAPTNAREQARARARAALGDRDRARFDEVLHVAERVHPQREENVLYTQSLPMGLMRRTLLDIGRRLVAAGALAVADDVVYLERAEIRPALEGRLTGEAAAVRVRRRQAERRWVRAHPGPAYHGPAPFSPPSTRGLPGALRRLLDAFIWETALETAPEAPASGSGMLSGAGASAGHATGRVRVIRGEDELSRFEAGEILVCPSTHSSWAVVFARAAAVVTDHGGVLSHPAIVAREYGIPAVVGTGSATTLLRDGQMVCVDGAAGRVEIVE
ncbi:MAG TPA: PEP/pyruvate-binding domain-containing protein [Vicinamibacterales bacterium]|jgi:pyruvate,water dikinase|nr:PEP/pyruvate-binding domain-containing protein [Vicinamibacterales bacterium]